MPRSRSGSECLELRRKFVADRLLAICLYGPDVRVARSTDEALFEPCSAKGVVGSIYCDSSITGADLRFRLRLRLRVRVLDGLS